MNARASRSIRTDVHNLLRSATQSDSTDPLGVYNTCLRQLLDRHAPLVTRTVTDRTSAPWMTLEIKHAKEQRRLAERKWRESGLAVHREIYVKQRNLVSNMISKAKKDYLCDKIVNCGSSRELFRLRGLIHETDLRGKLRPKHEVRNYRRKVAIHERGQREVATKAAT